MYSIGRRFLMGDPGSQLLSPAPYLINEELTLNEHAISIASDGASQQGVAQKVRVMDCVPLPCFVFSPVVFTYQYAMLCR